MAVSAVTAGTVHMCALLTTGKVRCWGRSESGELGYGNKDTVGDDETPASVGDVDVGGPAQQIAVSSAHTCALLDDGHGALLGVRDGWRARLRQRKEHR